MSLKDIRLRAHANMIFILELRNYDGSIAACDNDQNRTPLTFCPATSNYSEMNSITTLTAKQLRHAADIQDRIESLQRELTQILGTPRQTATNNAPKKRTMSRVARAKIASAARARWAKIKGRTRSGKAAQKPKRKMTAAGKAKLSALAKARWKKAKAAGRASL